MKKGFDKVWHKGVLYKLALLPLPAPVAHLLCSYLTDRTFRISVDGAFSRVRPVAAGVHLWSALGPVQYVMYTNDLPAYPGVTLFLLANDAMFDFSSISPWRTRVMLQRQLDILPDCVRK